MAKQYAVHICEAPAYLYGRWYFEVHSYCGPHPLNLDSSVKRTDSKGNYPMSFYWMWEEFSKLPKAEQEKYRAEPFGLHGRPKLLSEIGR